MSVSVDIIFKGLPKDKIEDFEDKVVYNVAVETREFTKGQSAYPYLTGELERSEVAEPILGGNKEYGLGAGVDYAIYVYNYNKANWTNPSTEAHWYYNVFKKKSEEIVAQAVIKAMKEIK